MMNAHAQIATPATPLPVCGLERGTEVLTLRGVQPVEALKRGDRIVTRSGARRLARFATERDAFRLEFEKPQVVLLSQGQIHSDTCLPYAA